MTEAQFQKQVTDLAERLHWYWLHIPTTQAVSRKDGSRYFRTVASGPLGKGWPDLVLVRDRRLIFAELKRDGETTRPEQDEVLELLRSIARWPLTTDATGVQLFVWRPSDWPQIEATLR